MKLPALLAKAREDAALSQVALAEKLGVSPSTVAGWELGTHSLRPQRAKQVARALGIEAGVLLEAMAS